MSVFTTCRHLVLIIAAFASLLVGRSVHAAEMRVWTAAAGGFTVEAELVALKPGDIAQLKTKDGRTIEVPLAQLQSTDQDYARKQALAAAPSSTTSNSGSPKLVEVQKQADRCRTPDEALILFKVLHDDETTSAADKAIAAARIAEYKQLAAEKKVRLNKQWVSAEEAAEVRKKADSLIRQGLELLKIGQEDLARRKFSEAAVLEPEEIRAEFILAFVYTIARSADKALPIFQRCLQRDPDNIAVLNNIAMLAASRGDWITMVTSWRKALAKQPDQRVVHNVGRFLAQSQSANVPIPKAPRDSLAGPYAELVASGKFEETDKEIGWLLMLIEASDFDFSVKDEESAKTPPKKSAVPEANDDGVVVGGGTGFVVHPGYVLTNAHVAVDDAVFEIQTADGKRLRATRVSKAHDADLALLKCEELTAPPLTLAIDIAPRGTDIMVFGYPEFTILGATLKATRGSISSIPDPKVEASYLYDAITNSGNSGGPVCDASGNVVAVHFASMNTASRYGCGVPATVARNFLGTALPGSQTVVGGKDKLDWPAVDAKVSPSTVLIWVRQRQGATSTSTSNVAADSIELPLCLFCGGNKGLRCVAPGCAKMRIANRGRSNCAACNGSGLVKCQVCEGLGVDIQLASVQERVKEALAAKGGSSTSTASTPASANTGAGTGTSSDDDKISPGMLQALRRGAKPGDPNSLSNGTFDQALGCDPGLFEKPTAGLSELEMPQILASLRSGDPIRAGETAKRLASSTPLAAFQTDVAIALENWLVNQPMRWKVKSLVSRAIVIWGRPQSRQYVHALLRDDSWVVRRQAAIAIGHSNDATAVPKLVECLLRPADFQGDHSKGQFDVGNERGYFMRTLIVLGEASVPELERVRPQQNVKVQEMIDFIIAACKEK